MLIVSGIIQVDPADEAAALEAAGPLVEATLAEEGNITYGFWKHPAEAGVLRVYEEWADDDALLAHMGTPHMAEFLGVMGSLTILGTDVHRHEAVGSQKLM
jgi:quinol monooxygenase YgiN